MIKSTLTKDVNVNQFAVNGLIYSGKTYLLNMLENFINDKSNKSIVNKKYPKLLQFLEKFKVNKSLYNIFLKKKGGL